MVATTVPMPLLLSYLSKKATISAKYDIIVDEAHVIPFANRNGITIVSVRDGQLAELARSLRKTLDNQGKIVDASVQNFVVNVVAALAIVIVTLLIFMGLKSGILIGLILAITIFGTFIVMDMAGLTLQRISVEQALREDPVMIVRSGGVAAARAYLDKARSRHNTSRMGSWHPFKVVKDVNQPQTTAPALSGNLGGTGSEDDDFHIYGRYSDYGIGADGNMSSTSMVEVARYVAVAPRDISSSVRNLPFVRE